MGMFAVPSPLVGEEADVLEQMRKLRMQVRGHLVVIFIAAYHL